MLTRQAWYGTADIAVEEGFNLDRVIWQWWQTLSSDEDPWTPAVVEVVRDVTALGSNVVLLMLVLSVSGYLVLSRNRSLAVWLIATVGTAVLLNHGLKEFFDRVRPDVVFQSARVFTPSFPSAHAMLSATAYSAVTALVIGTRPRCRRNVYLCGVAALLILFVGLSRMYLGVHWFTDILAGWAIGLGWTWLAWWVYRRFYLERTGRSGAVAGSTR